MAIEITARKREAQGTGPSRRLRIAGKVPGILYGGDQAPGNIELDHKDLFIKHKNENPVVATVIVPALITEGEEAAAEVVAPSEVPTTEQAAPLKEGEAAAEGEKPAAKGAEKTAEKAEKPEKPEKKEKK